MLSATFCSPPKRLLNYIILIKIFKAKISSYIHHFSYLGTNFIHISITKISCSTMKKVHLGNKKRRLATPFFMHYFIIPDENVLKSQKYSFQKQSDLRPASVPILSSTHCGLRQDNLLNQCD